MNLIYWLFAIVKKTVPFESESSRATLQAEMQTEYDKLDANSNTIGGKFKKLTMSVWFRFFLVLLFIPAHRYAYNFCLVSCALLLGLSFSFLCSALLVI